MSDTVSLKGQVAIVTGGSRGYGAGIAEALAREGAKVWITGRTEAVLLATGKRLAEFGVRTVRADVSSASGWDRLCGEIMSEVGRLDILVNNAGEGIHIASVADQTDEAILRSIATNLTGSLLGCWRAAVIMKRQRSGLIVNIGSVCAKHAWPGWSVYSAAKAGLLQFTRCLLTELRPLGVRVTSVLPSWGQTDFAASAKLPPRGADTQKKCIAPLELGALVAQIANLPPHLVAEEITLWPMVQPIQQL
jgi:NAD(P)-dependent dehydrogenase (short-subunit alcohol dehydrogenase family)